jgi:hypothetical protein
MEALIIAPKLVQVLEIASIHKGRITSLKRVNGLWELTLERA